MVAVIPVIYCYEEIFSIGRYRNNILRVTSKAIEMDFIYANNSLCISTITYYTLCKITVLCVMHTYMLTYDV